MKTSTKFSLATLLLAVCSFTASAQISPPSPDPSYPPPLYPHISSVANAPWGVVLDFSGGHSNTYDVQRSIGNGNWSNVAHTVNKYTSSSNQKRLSVSVPLDTDTNNIRFRVRACDSRNKCSGYSMSSQPVNFTVYEVDLGDDNGNGIRNDVEKHIAFLAAPSTRQYDYLYHYAYFMSDLVNGTYSGGVTNGMLAFINMAQAFICLADDEKAIEVKAMVLDSEAAYARYHSATSAFANSIYSGYDGRDVNCGRIATYNPSSATITSAISAPEVYASLENGLEGEMLRSKVPGEMTESASASTQNSIPYVIHINGIATDHDKALRNNAETQKLFNYKGRSDVKVELSYNHTEGFLSDVFQAFKQYTSHTNKNKGYYELVKDLKRFDSGLDLKNISEEELANYYAQRVYGSFREGDDINRLKALVRTVKDLNYNAVILAHSQGNFFANEVWEEFNLLNGGTANEFLRVHALGTPASYVAGGGHYYSNHTDKVVNLINKTSPVKALPTNANIPSDDWTGHGFLETYMQRNAYYTNRTISEILQHHWEMEQLGPGGTCVPFYNRGLDTTGPSVYVHTPFEGYYKGDLTFRALGDQIFADNYIFTDERGVVLWQTGFLYSGEHQQTIAYDSTLNGVITITVYSKGTNRFQTYEYYIECP